jgi:3'(2'), 5'-bisphosphate nucleotidase
MQYSSNILDIIKLAVEAGDIIMKHYKTNMLVQNKSDNSPVTVADTEADEFIFNGLKKITPNLFVISEEGFQKEFKKFNDNPQSYPERPKDFWLVDPIDGTKSFIRGEKEWTVNIALVENNQAVFGVIYAPAMGKLFFTDKNFKARKLDLDSLDSLFQGNDTEDESGAVSSSRKRASKNFNKLIEEAEIITTNQKPNEQEGYRILASKNHRNKQTEDYINSIKVKEFIPASSSYKFCLLAVGRADLYPRFGDTMLWDTAAGQAILEAAGGKMFKTEAANEQNKIKYNFSLLDINSLKNSHFIAKI